MLPPKAYKRKTRPIRIEGDLAYVPLTKGYEAIIDASDVDLIKEFSWNAKETRGVVYARCAVFVDGIRRHFYMHQVINPVDGGHVPDHINGNGLDNRRENLRSATLKQNARNIRNRPWTCTNGVRKAKGQFGAWLYIGLFPSKGQALEAVLSAEKALGLE